MSEHRHALPVETNREGVMAIIEPKPERPVSAKVYNDGCLDLFLQNKDDPLRFRIEGETALRAIQNGLPVAACEADADGPARWSVLDLTYAETAKESV